MKFSGPGKFTLEYRQFEIKGVELEIGIGNVSKLYSLILSILRYQSLKFQELTVNAISKRQNLAVDSP